MKFRWLFLLSMLLVIIGVAYVFMSRRTESPQPDRIVWEQEENIWKASRALPECPSPLELNLPVTKERITSVLYPGQVRSGGGYEVGAGFRLDGTPNDSVNVTVPMDAVVVQAARFLVHGEIQYMFDLITPCGYLFRYDHLQILSPAFQALADTLPEAKEGDSRTTTFSPAKEVTQGEIMATGVGLRAQANTFLSWGVYDLRQKNIASRDASWASQHSGLEQYAVCPFDLLSNEDKSYVVSLPAADPVGGKTSDFCR